MEPLFFKAENIGGGGTALDTGAASMEPLFFKAENCAFSSKTRVLNPRFNGAAFFQSGKLTATRRQRQRYRRLQWSRFFSKRKILFCLTERFR